MLKSFTRYGMWIGLAVLAIAAATGLTGDSDLPEEALVVANVPLDAGSSVLPDPIPVRDPALQTGELVALPNAATITIAKDFAGPAAWRFGFVLVCDSGFSQPFSLAGGTNTTFQVQVDGQSEAGLRCTVAEELLLGDWTTTVTLTGVAATLPRPVATSFPHTTFLVFPGSQPTVTFENVAGYGAQQPTGQAPFLPAPGPQALDDRFQAIGNVGLTVVNPTDGILANDVDPQGNAAVTAFDAISTQGGGVAVNPDGTFAYTPAAGFQGIDTFNYTITDGLGGTSSGLVTITLDNLIWFIDAAAAPAGDGTRISPFDTVNNFNTLALDQPGDIIHIAANGADYPGARVGLLDNQQLIGAGVDLAAASGIVLPPFTPALPGAATAPTLTDNLSDAGLVDLGSSNTIAGLRLRPVHAAGLANAIRGNGQGGNTVVDAVTILSAPGVGAIRLNGQDGSFTITNSTLPDGVPSALPPIHILGGSVNVNLANTQITYGGPQAAVLVELGHNGNFGLGPASSVTATDGSGLQFDNADGTYDFQGTATLNGGDAGIDILGGTGTFTFTDTTITDPTGLGLGVSGGGSNVTFLGTSSITKNNAGSAIRVDNGHSGIITFDPGTVISATGPGAGDGLQFDNTDGIYDFRGQVTLNGGDAGIDILGGSAGTFTFTNTDISSPTGSGINLDGSSAMVTFGPASSLTQGESAAAINVVNDGGSLRFEAGSTVAATDGSGLQFDNADGTYDFPGAIDLNGGDAGIDILGGSAGTFTFGPGTSVTNPTGSGVKIQDLDSGGDFDFDGSIVSNTDVILSVDTTAAGSTINFNTTGGNSLTSTNNPNGGIFLFDVDGNLTMTTPTTITRPGFSALFATDGDGIWTFNDLAIIDQTGLNGGIDVFGQSNVINFHNLNISTDSAGTGDGTTGFLAGGDNIINVTGNSSVNTDGGGALVLINISSINMTFQSLTSTNNTNAQVGFAGDDGIDLLNVAAGTLNVPGLTTVRNADGVGISIEDTGATVTFSQVDIDGIGLDGVIAGVTFDSPGTININGGAIANTGGDGVRIGSGLGSGVAAFNLNNTTFSTIGGFIAELGNSGLSGSGNVAAPFSCNDLGGNTGSISFNGGVDTCP